MVIENLNDVLFEKCIEDILSMGKNRVFDLFDFMDIDDKIPRNILQIYLIEILLSMEKNKFIKAKKIFKIHFLNCETYECILNEIIRLFFKKKYLKARDIILHYLNKNPKDMYLFYVCHMIDFNFGFKDSMLKVLDVMQIKPENKFYSYYEGIKAFILSENSIYKQSFLAAKQALKMNKKDIYALHAICHYYYDTKKFVQGKKLMQNQRDLWMNNYSMRLHLSWHYALFLFYTHDLENIEKIYKFLRVKNNENALEDLDASSLAVRLKVLYNMRIDFIEADIKALFDSWNCFKELGFYFFNDFHAALVFVLANRVDLIDVLIKKTRLSLPFGFYKHKIKILKAIKYYHLKRYDKVIYLLDEKMDYSFMGGSRAQRNIIYEILKQAKLNLRRVNG